MASAHAAEAEADAPAAADAARVAELHRLRVPQHQRQRHRPDLRPLYLDDAALKARQEQVAAAATEKRHDRRTARSGSTTHGAPSRRRACSSIRADGRMPSVWPNVENRGDAARHLRTRSAQLLEDFSLYERCITRGIGGSILHVIYGNGNRIVQSPGAVAFGYEMLSDTRIFYTDGRPHVGQDISMYLGDSRARWEGEELVVETTNLTDLTAFGVNGNGTRHSKAMKITERFRRVADDIIQYQATWDDPLTFEAPFTVSFPLTPLDGGICFRMIATPATPAISMALGAERAEDTALAADLAKGIKRARRTVQDCGAGVGGAPVAGCTPGAPAAAVWRWPWWRTRRRRNTGEDTIEK